MCIWARLTSKNNIREEKKGVSLSEGAGHTTRVTLSYTSLARRAVSVVGLPFSQLQVDES